MRFDDTLETVLAGDLSTPFGTRSAWRQLVDLIGRRRVAADPRALATLRSIRGEIPLPVRAASARGLEYADPPAALVRLFAIDEISAAAPVLRAARLTSGEWVALLPELSPAGRAVLRGRRDLSPMVRRALDSFGKVDFVLPDVERSQEPMTESEAEIEAGDGVVLEEAGWAETHLFEDVVGDGPFPQPEPVVPELEPLPEPRPLPEPLSEAPEPAQIPDETELAAEVAVSVEPETGERESGEDAEIAGPPETPEPVEEAEETQAAETPEEIEETRDGSEVVASRSAEPVPLPPKPLADAPLDQILDWLTLAVRRPPALPACSESVAPEAASIETDATAGEAPVDEAALAGDAVSEVPAETESVAGEVVADDVEAAAEPIADAGQAEEPLSAIDTDDSFITLATVARVLPSATNADRNPGQTQMLAAVQSGTIGLSAASETVAKASPGAQASAMLEEATQGGGDGAAPQLETPVAASQAQVADGVGPFEIADVVARIDAFWRKRDEFESTRVERPPLRAEGFRFETDSNGVIRWVEGVSRAPLIGLSLDISGLPNGSRVDGVAAGAFRHRAGFSSARMQIEGESDAAGDWLISGIPVFDPGNGRFTGYRGTARRPRVDERAEPAHAPPAAADSLRQLVHELRTPTNAIAGFAEMIETEILGPVPDCYRDRAQEIRGQAKSLLGAIDDLDLAARIESAALALMPDDVRLRPLLAGIADDLMPLAGLRGSWIALPIDDLAVMGDRRAVERLLARLIATLVSASGEGERVGIRLARDADEMVQITLDRPKALADYPGEEVLGIDDEGGDATLLGTGFALRLARNLARELGGSLVIEPESLTLRLPAVENHEVEQAHLV